MAESLITTDFNEQQKLVKSLIERYHDTRTPISCEDVGVNYTRLQDGVTWRYGWLVFPEVLHEDKWINPCTLDKDSAKGILANVHCEPYLSMTTALDCFYKQLESVFPILCGRLRAIQELVVGIRPMRMESGELFEGQGWSMSESSLTCPIILHNMGGSVSDAQNSDSRCTPEIAYVSFFSDLGAVPHLAYTRGTSLPLWVSIAQWMGAVHNLRKLLERDAQESGAEIAFSAGYKLN